MDAAWKVYVGDRRFDDNQISNLFLKLKYETVGRFTFDFRPIDGDESYMVVNNTLRIFWGDLHRLDGVIQRVDWDDTQYCYHVFGADIRGFLLDRVNMEPATVNSYTSDVQSYVQYEGCDFPSNIWTGAGEQIGKYTFHYKIGIQNTIRITGATQNRWYTVVERGTVYDHVNGCLYDATKNWVANEFAGATLRFVSGACKNNVYNINGNTSNRVCIRLPGEPATMYATGATTVATKVIDGVVCGQILQDAGFESGDIETGGFGAWKMVPYAGSDSFALVDGHTGNHAVKSLISHDAAVVNQLVQRVHFPARTHNGPFQLTLWARCDDPQTGVMMLHCYMSAYSVTTYFFGDRTHSEEYTPGTTWRQFSTTAYVGLSNSDANDGYFRILSPYAGVEIDDVELWVPDYTGDGAAEGTIPGCSRLGDIYEIVQPRMERIEPASLAPATLEKDNHIIRYNNSDDLSDHTTVVTVMGAD